MNEICETGQYAVSGGSKGQESCCRRTFFSNSGGREGGRGDGDDGPSKSSVSACPRASSLAFVLRLSHPWKRTSSEMALDEGGLSSSSVTDEDWMSDDAGREGDSSGMTRTGERTSRGGWRDARKEAGEHVSEAILGVEWCPIGH